MAAAAATTAAPSDVVKLREGAQPRSKAEVWKLFRSCDPLRTLTNEIDFITNGGRGYLDKWHNGGFRAENIKEVAEFVGNDKLNNIPLLAVAIVLFRNERIGFASDKVAVLKQDQELIEIDAELEQQIENRLAQLWRAANEAGMNLRAPLKLEDVAFRELTKDVDFKVDPTVLGAGNFGRVHRAAYLSNNLNVAYKELFVVSPGQVADFNNEVAVLQVLSHPNVVRVYGKSTSPNHLGLIVELMDCSLRSKLAILTIPQRKYVLTELAKGLAYLHAKETDGAGVVTKPRVLHRDLKSDNALVSNDLTIVKLSDFGLSRTITSTQAASSVRGTPLMMAPEVYGHDDEDDEDEGYHCPADVWSFGMLMFEVLAGRMPYSLEIERKVIKPKRNGMHIASGKLPSMEPIRDAADPEVAKMVDIMQKCIQQDPNARPTMSDVVALLLGPQPAAPAATPVLGAAAGIAPPAAAGAPAAAGVPAAAGAPAAASTAAAAGASSKRKSAPGVESANDDEPHAKVPRTDDVDKEEDQNK